MPTRIEILEGSSLGYILLVTGSTPKAKRLIEERGASVGEAWRQIVISIAESIPGADLSELRRLSGSDSTGADIYSPNFDLLAQIGRTLRATVENPEKLREALARIQIDNTSPPGLTFDSRLFTIPSGEFCLSITEGGDSASALFSEQGLQGGGYTWAGIINALINKQFSDERDQFRISAEADNAAIYCKSENSIKDLEKAIAQLVADPNKLENFVNSVRSDLE